MSRTAQNCRGTIARDRFWYTKGYLQEILYLIFYLIFYFKLNIKQYIYDVASSILKEIHGRQSNSRKSIVAANSVAQDRVPLQFVPANPASRKLQIRGILYYYIRRPKQQIRYWLVVSR